MGLSMAVSTMHPNQKDGSALSAVTSKQKNTITKATKTRMTLTYKPEKPGTYRTIPAGTICQQAAFVFDHPVTFMETNWVEMDNGQFWLCESVLGGATFRFPIEGKWTDGR